MVVVVLKYQRLYVWAFYMNWMCWCSKQQCNMPMILSPANYTHVFFLFVWLWLFYQCQAHQCDIIARTHGCVRNDNETHETVLLDCTTGEDKHILYKRNWNGFWLMTFTQKKVTRNYIFFKFAICSIALLSLGETCHLKGHDMVTV